MKWDEIPKLINGSNCVIFERDSMYVPWTLIEANIAYCTEEPANMLTLYYTVNMATIVNHLKKRLKTEGITDLTLFTEKIDFNTE